MIPFRCAKRVSQNVPSIQKEWKAAFSRLNCLDTHETGRVKAAAGEAQGNSIYFPEITICSTLGLKAAI